MRLLVAITLGVLLSSSRCANDQAAKGSFPSTMLQAWSVGSAAGEQYYFRASGKPDRIILYLHTWSTDLTQATTFPELTNLDNALIVAPNFNGVNNSPNACSSDDALQRIKIVLAEVQYKTGLKRVYLVGASGGGMAALAFMGKYPGLVHRASIWVPIYDMAKWYYEADQAFKNDMVACFGRPPLNTDDSLYRSRSPVERLNGSYGPTYVVLNAASNDTTVPVQHSRDARDKLKSLPDVTVEYIETAMGHSFNVQTALQQLLIE